MIALAAATAMGSPANDEGSFQRNLKVSGPVVLHVSTGSGYVRVSKGSPGEVRIAARIRANNWTAFWSASPGDEIRDVERNPPVRQEGSRVTVGSDVRKWERLSISYDITAPPDTNVRASSGSGNVEAFDVHGPADLSTGSGTVTAERIGAEVQARSGSGNIRVARVEGDLRASTGSGRIEIGDVTGTVDASNGSGNINVTRASGKVRAHTGSGHVRIERANADLDVHSASGGVEVDGAPKSAHWDLSSSSGGVRVLLPQATGFELDARAGSGNVSTTHPVSVTGSMRHGELRGVSGHGDNLLRIRTASGNIRIE